MKQSQKLLIIIGLGVLILMNVLALGWVISDIFSGLNEPEKTVAATDDRENTTGAEPTEETSATPSLPKVEQVFEAVKKPIHSWSVGSGQGDIGYSESTSEKGPNGFSVEGNDICVLDVVNDRILFHYGDGNDSYDSISNLQRVYSENGWNAVINYNGYYIDIYYREEKIADIYLRDSGIGKVSEIISIDNTGVVFEALPGHGRIMKYRYDWSTGKLEERGNVSRSFYIEIDGNDAIILGEVGDKVYYWYRDGMTNIIGVEVENVGRWYVTQELSGYHSVPANNLYVSKDGKLYLMECFNDQVVISELMLGEPVEEPTEEPTEDTTKEPTPYGEVLEEYFAKREVLYTATEIDPGWWEAVQEYMISVGWNVLSDDMSYNIVEIISETETEVKLHLIEIAEITYVFDKYVKKEYESVSLGHIIRLSKQDGTYQIVADSCYDMNSSYQSGLEEDIKLLKPGVSVAG